LIKATHRGATTSSKLGGPVPWYRVLLPFHRKKIREPTQFGAVGYIITLFIKKLLTNLGDLSKFWGVRPPVVAPMATLGFMCNKLKKCGNNLAGYRSKHGYISLQSDFIARLIHLQ